MVELVDTTKTFITATSVYIIMSAVCVEPVISEMKIGIEGKERETIIEPLYKKVDKNGRIYVNIDLAGQEALILVVKPEPEDKIKYIKVGRS